MSIGILTNIISIHSLIRGRTASSERLTATTTIFQSTPSYEGEPHPVGILSFDRVFQSTPSYEGEQQCRGYPCQRCYFNPLPHTRENEVIENKNGSKTLFQSTPSYEGEPLSIRLYSVGVIFQSTPSYEGERAYRPIWKYD